MCGGVSVAILKTSPLLVCTNCHVGMIPNERSDLPPTFIHPDDVPKLLSRTHRLNKRGNVVPVNNDHVVTTLPQKKICKRGHFWVDENIFTSRAGYLSCRVCRIQRSREYRRAKRGPVNRGQPGI